MEHTRTHTEASMAAEDEDFRRQAAKLATTSLDYEKARQIEKDLDDDQLLKLGFRKMVHTIGDPPGEHLDHLEAAYRTVDFVEQLSKRVERLEETVVEMQSTVEAAMELVEQGVEDEGDMSKTQRAVVKTRDELVYRLARDKTGDGASVTIAEVQQKLRPEHDTQYELVKRAFQKLECKHEGFHTGENQDGDRCMFVSRGDVSRGVVVACESSLGRDDLTHSVVTSGEGGRG